MSFADGFNTNRLLKKADSSSNHDFDYEAHIRANIRKIMTNISAVERNLADLNRDNVSLRLIESMQSHLSDTYRHIEETEQMFKDWTIHMAGNPLDKQKKKFAFSKLFSNFHFEINKTHQLAFSVDEAAQRVANQPQNHTNFQIGSYKDPSTKNFPQHPINLANHEAKEHIVPSEIEWFISDSGDEPYSQDNLVMEMNDGENDFLIKRRITEEKLSGLKKISKQVIQAHQVFKDLASLLVQQDEDLERIESNLDYSYIQSSKAINELEKSYKYYIRKRKRRIILLVAGVFALVLLLWMTTGLPFGSISSPKKQLKK